MKHRQRALMKSHRRRKRSGSKAIAQKYHAKRRFCQRLDHSLSEKEYQNLISQIQSGKAEFLERQSNRISLFHITIEDKAIIAVYDKNTSKITTFLTAEMFRERHGNIINSDKNVEIEKKQ